MELEKIYRTRGVTAALPVRRVRAVQEDAAEAFEHILQNLRESKSANARDRSDTEGDTVVTRVLADGSVIVRVYKGTVLISETMTRGSNPEAGKAVIIEHTEKLKTDSAGETQNPLLASKAAQSSIGTAALVSSML